MVAQSTRRGWRVAKVVLVAGIACYLALLVFVQISEWTVRRRAERLLADFRGLRAGTSTMADAQAFMGKWSRWEEYSQCGAAECEFWVGFRDWMWKPIGASSSVPGFLPRTAVELLRDHLPIVTAELQVKDGLLDGASLTVLTVVPKGHGSAWGGAAPDPDGCIGYMTKDHLLSASAISVAQSQVPDPAFPAHAQYMMRPLHGQAGCVRFSTTYTTEAQPDDVLWLTSFDFSCMTRWSTCTHAGELLPEAWKRYEAEPGSRRQ